MRQVERSLEFDINQRDKLQRTMLVSNLDMFDSWKCCLECNINDRDMKVTSGCCFLAVINCCSLQCHTGITKRDNLVLSLLQDAHLWQGCYLCVFKVHCASGVVAFVLFSFAHGFVTTARL